MTIAAITSGVVAVTDVCDILWLMRKINIFTVSQVFSVTIMTEARYGLVESIYIWKLVKLCQIGMVILFSLRNFSKPL